MSSDFIPTHYLPIAVQSDMPDEAGDLRGRDCDGETMYVRAAAVIPASLVTVVPAEPKGVGAVAADADGERWVRLADGSWALPGYLCRSWAELMYDEGPLTVVSGGVEL